MTQQAETLLALGTPDRRLDRMPELYHWLLRDENFMRFGEPDGLGRDEHARLVGLAPRVEAASNRLADYGVPQTIHHDDFHDGNVFVHQGRYSIADWAESSVTHPFFSLVVGLRAIAYRFGLPAKAPEFCSLRDHYLEYWTGFAPLQRL